MDEQTISKYDRLYSGMKEVGLMTKPSTIKVVQALTGRAETFIIQTGRDERGDYIFVEMIDETGSVIRIAIPPKGANAIAAQRASLTTRKRSVASKARMKERMAQGWKPNFQKKQQ